MPHSYTQEQLGIAVVNLENSESYTILKRIERSQKQLVILTYIGFTCLLGLMAHGFKWLG